MKSRNQANTDRKKAREPATQDDLERVTNPMTVLFGYTQLLQRRLRRGQEIDNAELLRVLGLMESASRTMITGMARLAEKLPPEKGDSTE